MRRLKKIKKIQTGLSLVELMVGMVIGLLVIAAALSTSVTTNLGARNSLGSAKLNMELRGAMDTIISDIRRAGYCNVEVIDDFCDTNTDSDNVHDFMAIGSTDLVVHDNGSCIIYSYDDSGNGELATSSDYEYFGFKIEDGAIEVRNGGAGDLANCDNGSWEPITDPENVIIDPPQDGGAYFSIHYSCFNSLDNPPIGTKQPGDGERCLAGTGNSVYNAAVISAQNDRKNISLIEIRRATINLRGHLANDASMSINLQDSVLVRNHRQVIVAP